jgi:hypothetical protein
MYTTKWRHTHPYLSELGGYPGWGWGVIGSDMVYLGFANFSKILTLHSIFKERNTIPALYANLQFWEDALLFYFLSQFQ